MFTGAGRVCGIVCSGGAAAEIVIFRANDDTPEYMRVHVPIATTVVVPLRWYAFDGLECITASAAGDVAVTVHYVKLGQNS